MGRATIVSETGSGQYVIKPIYNIKNLEERRAELIKSRLKLYDEISALKDKINVLSNDRGAILSQLYIDIDTANLEAKGEELLKRSQDLINETTKLLLDKDKKIIDTTQRLTESEFHLAENQLAVNQIDTAIGKYKNPFNVSAWCADLTEGLTGEVGTIEIDDETNKPNNQEIVINAGGAINPAIGTVTPVASMLDYEAAYRIITLPMYQNIKPRYRAGKVTAINAGANTCSVSFASEYHYSSVIGEHRERFELFKSASISDVPAQYLTCNIDAFSVGDYVIVDFKGDWKTPTVIGFVSSPKSCGVHGFLLKNTAGADKFAKTGTNKIISVKDNVAATLKAGAYRWTSTSRLLSWGGGEYGIFESGSLFYSTIKTVKGACVKKINNIDVLLFFYYDSYTNSVKYKFVRMSDLNVMGAGALGVSAIGSWYQDYIAINASCTECKILVMTADNASTSSANADSIYIWSLVTASIDFAGYSVTVANIIDQSSRTIHVSSGSVSETNGYHSVNTIDGHLLNSPVILAVDYDVNSVVDVRLLSYTRSRISVTDARNSYYAATGRSNVVISDSDSTAFNVAGLAVSLSSASSYEQTYNYLDVSSVVVTDTGHSEQCNIEIIDLKTKTFILHRATYDKNNIKISSSDTLYIEGVVS